MKNILLIFLIILSGCTNFTEPEPKSYTATVDEWGKTDTATTHADSVRDATHQDSIRFGIIKE